MTKWATIPGFQNRYKISDMGEIYSFCSRRYLKSHIGNSGYLTLELASDVIAKKYLIHRLVLFSFVGKDINNPQVNHKNGIKIDNRLENLEWSTVSKNALHAYAIGLHSKAGEKNSMVKLSASEVLTIRELYVTGNYTQKELAFKFKVTQSNINAIVNYRSWPLLGGPVQEVKLSVSKRKKK